MPPFFTTFYTQWPPIVAFSVKIFQRNQKCVKIAWILCNFMPNDPLFGFVTWWVKWPTPFLQENCHWWSLELMHQYEHPCHFCMLVLPQEGGTVPKQHGSFKFGHKYYNKGADLKSSLRVSSQISSKHTYLLVPSGIYPWTIGPISTLKSRFLTGVIIYILNLIVRLHQKGFNCFHF